MSLARVVTVNKSRKDQGTCEKCGVELPKGSPYRHYSVGFRGRARKRCLKPECTPLNSERESSMTADVYAAQEDFESRIGTADSIDVIEEMLEEVATACDGVADEYESNEMYERNYDLQERAEMIRSAGDELRNWSADEAPDRDDYDEDAEEDFDADFQGWLDDMRESARDAVTGMELP